MRQQRKNESITQTMHQKYKGCFNIHNAMASPMNLGRPCNVGHTCASLMGQFPFLVSVGDPAEAPNDSDCAHWIARRDRLLASVLCLPYSVFAQIRSDLSVCAKFHCSMIFRLEKEILQEISAETKLWSASHGMMKLFDTFRRRNPSHQPSILNGRRFQRTWDGDARRAREG